MPRDPPVTTTVLPDTSNRLLMRATLATPTGVGRGERCSAALPAGTVQRSVLGIPSTGAGGSSCPGPRAPAALHVATAVHRWATAAGSLSTGGRHRQVRQATPTTTELLSKRVTLAGTADLRVEPGQRSVPHGTVSQMLVPMGSNRRGGCGTTAAQPAGTCGCRYGWMSPPPCGSSPPYPLVLADHCVRFHHRGASRACSPTQRTW